VLRCKLRSWPCAISFSCCSVPRKADGCGFTPLTESSGCGFLVCGKGWRSHVRIMKADTVIAWNRKGFRLYWTWKSRGRQGRPCTSHDIGNLIRKMSLANPGWGAPRIHGELLKLGIDVGETTVANRLVCLPSI